jgi:hypothetical protein
MSILGSFADVSKDLCPLARSDNRLASKAKCVGLMLATQPDIVGRWLTHPAEGSTAATSRKRLATSE